MPTSEETLVTISLSLSEEDLWLQAQKAFGSMESIPVSRLQLFIGRMNHIRQLKRLGLIDLENGVAVKTNVAVTRKQKSRVLGDSSGHYGFAISDDLDRISSAKESASRFTKWTRDQIVEAISQMTDADRLHLKIALSTVDWSNLNATYWIRRTEYTKIGKEMGLKCSKADLIEILGHLGFDYQAADRNIKFYVPSWFRDLKL